MTAAATPSGPMSWIRTHHFDRLCCDLADRHYPAKLGRRKIGSPQFVPPGKSIVLRTLEGDAAWAIVVPQFRRDEWAGAWINSFFRNESEHLSSELVRQAIAATRFEWGDPPAKGVVTFIDVDSIRRKRDPGRCYRKAGFEPVGYTKVFKRLVLRLAPELLPEPIAPLRFQLTLDAA